MTKALLRPKKYGFDPPIAPENETVPQDTGGNVGSAGGPMVGILKKPKPAGEDTFTLEFAMAHRRPNRGPSNIFRFFNFWFTEYWPCYVTGKCSLLLFDFSLPASASQRLQSFGRRCPIHAVVHVPVIGPREWWSDERLVLRAQQSFATT
jgi:hypothetical protein